MVGHPVTDFSYLSAPPSLEYSFCLHDHKIAVTLPGMFDASVIKNGRK